MFPGFRSLLACFNAEKALQPIAELVDQLRDAEVEPIVSVLNKYLLSNYKLMYQLEQTYNTLDRMKIIDVTFQQFGKLLENEEFVSSAIALLKEQYARGERDPVTGIPTLIPDPDLLTWIKLVARKIQRDNIAEAHGLPALGGAVPCLRLTTDTLHDRQSVRADAGASDGALASVHPCGSWGSGA